MYKEKQRKEREALDPGITRLKEKLEAILTEEGRTTRKSDSKQGQSKDLGGLFGD